MRNFISIVESGHEEIHRGYPAAPQGPDRRINIHMDDPELTERDKRIIAWCDKHSAALSKGREERRRMIAELQQELRERSEKFQ